MRAVCLMYHDVHEEEAGAPDIPAGALRYHLPRKDFQRHLEALAPAWEEGRVSLTFDDGWLGSLTIGVEQLLAAGMHASFFVTRDFVGEPHFADAEALREAHKAGMTIGTHGATHRLLTTLPEHEIRDELSSSKAFLEDLLGAELTAGSVPGGAWSQGVAEVAAACSYETLYTSRPGVNDETTNPLALQRIPIRRGTTAAAVERFTRLDVRREIVRARALDVPRALLGRERYARLRACVLGETWRPRRSSRS